MSPNLFKEETDTKKTQSDLIRIKSDGKPLSTEQYTFNKLVKRIATLQKLITEDAAKLDNLNKYYGEKIQATLSTLGNLKIQLCHLLDEKRIAIKLSQTQQFKLDNIICDLLEEGLSINEPSPETQKLYTKYFPEPSDEMKRQIEEEEKEMFCDMFYERFGLHIDPSMLTDNPDFEKIQAELEEQMKVKKAKKSKKQEKTKQTKKQKEKELLQQHKKDLKDKSLRSIYIGLAKLLHPDAEPDENLKLEKEEMMKQVTIAYNNKDLMSLLRLEMQWISAFKNKFDEMDGDLLKVYLELLRDQVKDLENERGMLIFQPQYAAIEPFLVRSMEAAVHEINFEAKRLRQSTHKIVSVIDQLGKGNRDRAVIQEFINEYLPEDEFLW